MSTRRLSFAPVFSGLPKGASEPFSRLPPLGKTVNGSRRGWEMTPSRFRPRSAYRRAHAMEKLHGCTAVHSSTQEDSHER